MARPDPASVALDQHAPARALIDRQLVLLTRLAKVGLEIAEAAGRAATADVDTQTRPDPGLAYARVARAVRLTIALQSRLLTELAALDRADHLAEAARAGARRRRIHKLVEQAIAAEHEADDEAIERLSSEAWERLIDEDDADLADRPLAEIVALICADLGLSPEQTAWALAACGGPADFAVKARPDIGGPTPAGPVPVAASLRPGARSRASPARIDMRIACFKV